jgi:hypothetical protein
LAADLERQYYAGSGEREILADAGLAFYKFCVRLDIGDFFIILHKNEKL